MDSICGYVFMAMCMDVFMDMYLRVCISGFVFMAMCLWLYVWMCLWTCVWVCVWVCVWLCVWLSGLDSSRGPVQQISGLTSPWGPSPPLTGLTLPRGPFQPFFWVLLLYEAHFNHFFGSYSLTRPIWMSLRIFPIFPDKNGKICPSVE